MKVTRDPRSEAEEAHHAVQALLRATEDVTSQHAAWLAAVHPSFKRSAQNFLHYLAVRQSDIRPLQRVLAGFGLSSFGLFESHVQSALTVVAQRLTELCGMAGAAGNSPSVCSESLVDFQTGFGLLQEHTRDLLGEISGRREVHIMVTLPGEAVSDPQLVPSLIEAGMEVARINCAHDDPTVWRALVQQVRDAALAQGRSCRVQIDLAGPKSRTGAIGAEGRLLKLRPRRDFIGKVVVPAQLWITPKARPMPAPMPGIPSLQYEPDRHPAALERLNPANRVHLTDARGRTLAAVIDSVSAQGVLLSMPHSAYLAEGTVIRFDRQPKFDGILLGAPEIAEDIRLKAGDLLRLTKADWPGHAAVHDEEGRLIEPAQLHCTLAAAFDDALPDQSVWLDDGRIGGLILSNDGEVITISITHAAPEGSRIKAEKGINFPDTQFTTPALTEKDQADLSLMAPWVDIVAVSFVRSAADVAEAQQALARCHQPNLGLVLKIENRQAFAALPAILLQGMQSARLGVMIARGDLAVEVGFERLSEVQEEILWMCEAAHVPVIWATQILESMAKSGLPTRPEVTDAAMSIRAECAMLNKGDHIISALWFLNAVLSRMEGHYSKRMAMRRALSIASNIPTLAANEVR